MDKNKMNKNKMEEKKILDKPSQCMTDISINTYGY